MEERRGDYGFCPRCGALMKDGVCQSCGYGKRFGGVDSTEYDFGEYEEPRKKKRRSGGSRIVLVLVILLTVLLAVFLVLAVTNYTNFKSRSSSLYIGDDIFGGFGDDDYDYDYSYDEYVPSESDEYYEEIANAVASDLSYGIEWEYLSRYPDGDSWNNFYSVACPLVTGGDSEVRAKVNEKIREMLYQYEETYSSGEYASGVYSTGYVTYMTEERLSIVSQNECYTEDYTYSLYTVSAVTFDMGTGEVIPYSEMVEVDEDLVKKFRSQDSKQNDAVEFVEDATDEELIEYLTDDDRRVVFLTPVGTELGFNYVDVDGWSGWVTVTLKENAL